MKRANKNMVQPTTGNTVKSITQVEETRAEQAKRIKASIVKELGYRESKMRFRVI